MQAAFVSQLPSSPPYLFHSPYRNFNLCPHCAAAGKEPTLWRYCEGFPMISRSDGATFHLVLADRPRPYPAERRARNSRYLSLCFFYQHGLFGGIRSVIVLMEPGKSDSSLYRQIEEIADLLAAELKQCATLSEITGIQRPYHCSPRISCAQSH
jgi:hypothetical protein